MIDLIVSFIALALCLVSFARLYSNWGKVDFTNRPFDYCIEDIRIMNTYNSYFLAAIMIFIGFSINKGTDILPASSLIMLLLAFVFASFAIFFIPLKRPKDGASSEKMKSLWLLTLTASQWVVILSAGGIVNAVLSKLL